MHSRTLVISSVISMFSNSLPGWKSKPSCLLLTTRFERCRAGRYSLRYAPTALILRFFSLPSNTRLWLDELLFFRSKIYDRKNFISKIKLKSITIELDKVKIRLHALIDDSRCQSARFRVESTILIWFSTAIPCPVRRLFGSAVS